MENRRAKARSLGRGATWATEFALSDLENAAGRAAGPYLDAIDVNSRGEIFVAGSLLRDADYAGTTITVPSTMDYASFIAKLPGEGFAH